MEERLRHLFKRYLDNTCSHAELEEFFGYIRRADQDELLRQLIKNTFLELKGTANTTHVDKSGKLVLNEPEWMSKQQMPLKKQPLNWLRPVSIAALLIVIAGIVWLQVDKSNGRKETRTLSSLSKKTTDRSESKFLLLEDSTAVWLNAASSLEFPDKFDPKKREVFLTGEAYFDVKHADKVPFIIHTGNISTTVLGTAFNIKAYPGQKNIIISVSRGKVKVSGKDGVMAVLEKGQQAKIEERTKEVKEKTIPAADVAAWQQGNIVFDDQSLEDITADMQRIYNAEIKISDESVREMKISTSFKKEIGAEQALQVLCKLMDKELSQKEGIYYIQ